MRKKYGKIFFCCIVKVTEERSRIRSWIQIWIHTKMSRILNTAFRVVKRDIHRLLAEIQTRVYVDLIQFLTDSNLNGSVIVCMDPGPGKKHPN